MRRDRTERVTGHLKRHKLTPAPDFTLTDIKGQPLRLADYKGKVVLLDFWATWCAPCRSEIPHFVAWQKQYGPQGLQVIGLSMDDDSKPVPAFMQQFGIDYPVAHRRRETGGSIWRRSRLAGNICHRP